MAVLKDIIKTIIFIEEEVCFGFLKTFTSILITIRLTHQKVRYTITFSTKQALPQQPKWELK